MMSINEIVAKIDELAFEHGYVGIRTQDGVAFELGAFDHNSHNFESRDLFGAQDVADAEELDGCSAWMVSDNHGSASSDAAKIVKGCTSGMYDHCAVLVSDDATYGMDEGEIVMQGASVALILM